jgi:hypothetical protein
MYDVLILYDVDNMTIVHSCYFHLATSIPGPLWLSLTLFDLTLFKPRYCDSFVPFHHFNLIVDLSM